MAHAGDGPGHDGAQERDGMRQASVPPPGGAGSTSSALSGRVLSGQYELDALLGEGAIGRVFRARRLADGQAVAVKLLHDRHTADVTIRKRFAREVAAARAIDHPGAVAVLDAGEDHGRPYVVMELLEGPSLREIFAQPDLTPGRLVDLLGQVLSVLQEAHRQGVVHRDLKPENVLVVSVGGRERVEVCDFGVAKIMRPEPGTAVTLEGMVCGTPEYMAPEQGSGGQVDGRSDLYAVGALLYEALTCSPPFQGKSPVATITQHITQPLQPPHERNPERPVPRELVTVCMRALQKDPERRYQSAREMGEALAHAGVALGGRASEPLGSSTFERDATPAPTARSERPTVPGALSTPARTRMGIALVALAVAGFMLLGQLQDDQTATEDASAVGTASDSSEPGAVPAPQQPLPPPGQALPPPSETSERPETPKSEGERALAQGRRRIRQNDLGGALQALRRASVLLGADDPRVLRAQGEAHHKLGEHSGARRALKRYLELEPDARDRGLVERWLQASK